MLNLVARKETGRLLNVKDGTAVCTGAYFVGLQEASVQECARRRPHLCAVCVCSPCSEGACLSLISPAAVTSRKH